MEDFHKHEAADHQKCREIAHNLYQAKPKVFPKRMDWQKSLFIALSLRVNNQFKWYRFQIFLCEFLN